MRRHCFIPFMKGKKGDCRSEDMQRPEPMRTKLMRLYDLWDEFLADLRRQAAESRRNIRFDIAKSRSQFASLRYSILAGEK